MTQPLRESMMAELSQLMKEGRLRTLPASGERKGAWHLHEGRRMLNLSSNDYLGIGSDTELLDGYLERCRAGSGESWMASTSSRLLVGNHHLYDELESRLAALYGKEGGLVFNSGYHANTGILPALAGRHDLILSDRLNHASIIDGARISDAKFMRYRHLDYAHLEELLEAARGSYRQVFIVTESVFSMDGDIADLARLVELKRKFDAMLVLDEAHGVGTFGTGGLGVSESSGLVDSVDIIIGTFGKAFASTGAYAVMDALVKEYLVNTMRPLIFTTALPPMVLGWSALVLERQCRMHQERRVLQHSAAWLRKELTASGFEVLGESHIVPVLMGDNERAVRVAADLRRNGVLALPIRPPTVPRGTARIRLSLRADLSAGDLQHVAKLLGREAL
ncbi:aminotransferase class I/II-fold pyridoxal phosphate-dependent enzyme [Prosthecochloris vibrioformis]|uniref:8-amino-7-oxononanoate synthase n=1 Tax=Prosthecochloris vibrioformis TaxID=1098 RepID=A0A5C4S3K8_PROVB|nr:8-amino-7-oxononanoate synthase [Prosthecochloris vibrioformis]TNJ37709.1 8-amino-7-oxononanoate synthase [Prosthecochloris vibrioformis]